jgi:FtsP/CotA-like multicopper oxidase with cupredoxin domain
MHIKIILVALLTFYLFSANSVIGAVREYSLTVARQPVTIGGKTADGMTINGSIPGPTLRFSEGDIARISVRNEMDVATSMHWHGLLVPPTMDGVPYVTQAPIEPGTTFVYEFPIRQTGTYWYHSHSQLQEQSGIYGSIVIEDGAHEVDRDSVVLLSDWSTESPSSILRTLKRGSHWYALEKGSSQSIFGAAKAGHLGDYFRRELQRMPPMDLADIAYDYFLANGAPQAALEAEAGERVRLRVINGSATTYFHLNYSGGPMTIISSDGLLVEPVAEDLFLIGVAETYDVLIDLPSGGAYEFRATAHDGSGFTSVWLGEGQSHPARTLPKPNLYEPMDHGDAGSLLALTPAGSMGMPDSAVEAGLFDKPGMSHEMHDSPQGSSMDMQDHGMMEVEKSGGMEDHAKMQTKKPDAMEDHEKMQAEKPDAMEDHAAMEVEKPGAKKEHVQMKMEKPDAMDDEAMMHAQKPDGMKEREMTEARPPAGSGDKTQPGSARPYGRSFGFLETDIASRANLASEGGPERPLTPYGRLRSMESTTLPADAPVREIRLTLDGDMERYTWFINNRPVTESDSIRIREGEIVRFIMINRTMMHHPMHLHGHFFRVINGQGDHAPLKHVVDVAPMSTTVIEFYSDEVGDWFFHCHLLYHMKSGMSRLIHYEDFQPSADVQDVRNLLYKDPIYFFGTADLSSNMTEGSLTLANSRFSLDAGWEVGWQQVEETEWEGLFTADYHFNRFSSLLAGINVLGEGSDEEATRGVFGFRYLLPLNFETTAWFDTDGGGRVILEKELQLTPRFELGLEAEYDTHKQWEGKVELGYQLAKNFSLIANWHSEYAFGAGIRILF